MTAEDYIIEDLEIRGAWFGANNVTIHNDQMSMFVDDDFLENDQTLYEVVEWFEKEFLPSHGLRLEDVFYHGDFTVFFR